MDLPWWGWVLVALWLAAGLGGFGVFLRRFESPYGVWYYLIGDEEFRGPFRTFSRSIPLVAVLLFCLLFGPLGLIIEVQVQRDEKLAVERKERLRDQRRQRNVAAEAARAAASQAHDQGASFHSMVRSTIPGHPEERSDEGSRDGETRRTPARDSSVGKPPSE